MKMSKPAISGEETLTKQRHNTPKPGIKALDFLD